MGKTKEIQSNLLALANELINEVNNTEYALITEKKINKKHLLQSKITEEKIEFLKSQLSNDQLLNFNEKFKFLNLHLVDCDLLVKTLNLLRDFGITRFGELSIMTKSEINNLPGVGKKVMEDIERLFQEKNIEFKN